METTESSPLLDLPEEVILRILSHLSVPDLVLGVRQTCRYLCDVSQMADLWKRVTLVARQPPVGPGPSLSDPPEFFLGMLRQKCVAAVTRELDADESGSGESDGEVEASPGRCSHSADDGGRCSHSVDDGGHCSHSVDDGGCCNHSADGGGISLVLMEKEVMDVATSVEERGDVPACCSITGGHVFYPNVKDVTLVGDCLPSTGFLSNYRDLCHLRIEKATKGRLSPRVSAPDENECPVCLAACFKNLVHCNTLKTFELIGHFPIEKPCDISAISDYFRSGPGLRRLQLDTSLTEDMVSTILDHCSELRDLQLSNSNLSVKAFRNVVRTPNRTLSALRLKGCQLQDNTVVRAMSEGFTNLQILELTIGDVHCRQCFQLLLSDFPELTVLKLIVLDRIFVEARRLSVKAACNDKHEKDDQYPCVVDGSPLPNRTEGKLQRLEVHVDGQFAIDSSALEEALCRQRALRSFKLTQCAGRDGCFQVRTERGLLQLHRGFRVPLSTMSMLMKTHLHMESIECPPSFSVIPWSQGTFVFSPGHLTRALDSRLRCLSLHSWSDASPRDLHILTSGCPGLTSLTITDVGRVSDDCVEVILRNCPRLQHFKLISSSPDSRRSRMSGKSGWYVQTWGRCLRSVVWLVGTGNFLHTDLARTLLLASPSLHDFTLSDHGHPQRSRHVISDIMTRELTRQRRMLRGLPGKRITVRRMRMKVDGCFFSEEQDALHFHVQRLLETGSADAVQSPNLEWIS